MERSGLRNALGLIGDVALAGFCATFAVLLTREVAGARPSWTVALAVGFAVSHSAVLVARRKAPRMTFVVVVLTAVAYVATGFAAYRLGPALLVATYTVTARSEQRIGRIALAVGQLVLLVSLLVGPGLPGLGSWAQYAALLIGSWALGEGVRRSQAAAAAHARRAEELQQAREELAHRAVQQERVRIARELHDVVAHSMSVIALQAGTGRLAAERDPTAARTALAVIEGASRGALAEMRRLLGVLRDAEDERDLAPAPALADLAPLLDEVRGSGIAVDAQIEAGADLPAAMQLCAYRIVQEALTNVLRHARATRATVAVRCASGELVVEVRDDGVGGPGRWEAGLGTVGMRERAALFGGALDVGPVPGGGWRVRAHLPLDGAA